MDEKLSSLHCFKFSDDWFKSSKSIRRSFLDKLKKTVSKAAFKDGFVSRLYSSFRYDADLLVWNIADSFEDLLSFKGALYDIKPFLLTETHSFFAVYTHPNKEYLKHDKKFKYMIAYPLKKDVSWYLLPESEKQRITKQHVDMALKDENNTDIRSYTMYSFGIDDLEFLLFYETDSILNWMKTAMDLRKAEARKWVTKEEPVFAGYNLML
ncbi:chlorite dismutase family protein [Candidatus Parvarchaeota archaeon]|nr:chlorite dismutase family protein [Candidatus Parvarchaeota archaeon]